MELAHPLDGLDSHPWSAFSHAYGSAEDLPDLLRALTAADADTAGEALSELYGRVLHQGTVYPASAEAAPFLAGIAVAGHRTADVLMLLGGMAESDDEHEVAPGSVREAVAEQLPLLLPLLDAVEPEVRQAAVWAVSHTRATAAVLPPLRQRWGLESEHLVRAEVLAGISRLDPPSGGALSANLLSPAEAAEVRMAAVFGCLDAGLPWTEKLHAATLSLLPADSLAADRLDLERSEPLAAVVEALLNRLDDGEREAAFALLDTALRDDRTEVRAEATWAAERACMLSRSAPQRLVPGLVEAAVDDAAVVEAASLLERLGTAAAQAAPVLTPLAGRNPEQDDDQSDRALAALVMVAPDQGAPLLARGLGQRPRALGAAAGFMRPADSAFPYDDELLDAVRRRLAEPEALSGNEPWQLTNLLSRWGVQASAALPQLYAMLPRYPGQAARAIAAIADGCPPSERARAATALRASAESGSLPAAKALWELTGKPEILLSGLAPELRRGSRETKEAAAMAGALGPQAALLAPALRAALSRSDDSGDTPVLDADTALAEALWRITRDAAKVIDALDSVFVRAEQNPWSQWSSVRAARVTALLGPAGRQLVGRLEALLAEPVQVPAAALALTAVAEPASVDRSALAVAVLDAAEQEADPVGACEALEALGAGALPAGHLPRLAALAYGDARVIRSGVENRIIHQDEAFRQRIGTLLSAFTDRLNA